MEKGLLQHGPPPPAGFSEMAECGSTQDFTGGDRCERGVLQPRNKIGRIVDLGIYDCNMKIGPTRRCVARKPISVEAQASLRRRLERKPQHETSSGRGAPYLPCR